ncbi:hypothetical protein F5Y06DRAFT_33778 [Hypoxylon sp. FL0890]|nr:hypothetical protein F5Y06DRAFT_33778 [Hypoxylon sp. FL0890]
MALFFIKSIPAVGIPVAMGLLGTAQGVPLDTTAVGSSVGGGCQVTAQANTALTTPVVGNSPQVTAPATQSIPNNEDYTVTLINSHTAPVVTMHGQGADSPTAVGKDNNPHTISRGETATFALPTGVSRVLPNAHHEFQVLLPLSWRLLTSIVQWSGRVAMFEDGYSSFLDRATLLEGSFMDNALNDAVIALDVSYVDGFTVPLVCECNSTIVTGCNLDLHPMCPQDFAKDLKTCANPNRDFKVGAPPTNPFKDCQGLAYTYPQDDNATKYDISGCSRDISCCIGTACKPHPGQLLCPIGDGATHPCGTP